MRCQMSLFLMSLALGLSGCANNNGLFQRQIVRPSDVILNCPMEPLVLFPGDPLPTEIDPATGEVREYVIVTNQNDAERFNEAVRRAGAICRNRVRANCQYYRDLRTNPVCAGLPPASVNVVGAASRVEPAVQ